MLIELLIIGGGLMAVGLGNKALENDNVRDAVNRFSDAAQRQTDRKSRELESAHERGRISDEAYERRRSELDDLQSKIRHF